jgi:RNA polymerase sigma-70 factor (ECF subfamily)
MPPERSEEAELRSRSRFPSTRWSLISSVRGADSRAEMALADLCQAYWPPVYAFARSRGQTVEQAEDLTQGFFTKLLERELVIKADRQRGRFRTYLLTAFTRFMANEHERSNARKRGGGHTILSMDIESAEGQLPIEAADGLTPETLFARQWARTLLNRALDRLTELERAAHPETFDRISGYLLGTETSMSYRELADELGMTEGAVKVSVHRLRKRFGQVLRDEVAETVDGSEAVTEELRFLLDALRS